MQLMKIVFGNKDAKCQAMYHDDYTKNVHDIIECGEKHCFRMNNISSLRYP